MDTKTKQGIV